VRKQDYCAYYTKQLNIIRGSQSNLERVYAAVNYIKATGNGNTLSQTFVGVNLSVDRPFFYSFNRSFNEFTENEISALIQVGTNLRYEASLFNTLLRREQARRGLFYGTVGCFSSLRYTQNHQGNSLRAVFALLENRSSFVKNLTSQLKAVSIISGVNSFRNDKAGFMQSLLRQLGKQFFVATKSRNRLGFVHSSIGSLAFSYLGLSSKTITNGYTNFVVAQPDHSSTLLGSKNFFTRLTASKAKAPVVRHAKTLYETTGHVIAFQGQLRKHTQVINPIIIDGLSKVNFETELASF